MESSRDKYILANQQRLETILDLGDRLSLTIAPDWTVSAQDGVWQLHTSDRDLSEDAESKEVILSTTQLTMLAALSRARMQQVAAMSEEQSAAIGDENPSLGTSDITEAWFIAHNFTNAQTGEKHEIYRYELKGTGFLGVLVEIEDVTVTTSDGLINEVITSTRVEGQLDAKRVLGPVDDELATRLVELSGMWSEDSSICNDLLYEAGFKLLTGKEDGIEKLEEALTRTEITPAIEQLKEELLERYSTVKNARQFRKSIEDTSLPSVDQLDETIGLLQSLMGG